MKEGLIADLENFIHNHKDKSLHLIDIEKLIAILKAHRVVRSIK